MFEDEIVQNYKISRIKAKHYNKMDIFDLLVIKTLSLMTNKIYLYVDDRSLSACETQTEIDGYLSLFRKFKIKLPDAILKYSDYYQTARAYIHYLIKTKKALLNYNTTHKYNDFNTIMRNPNTKVFLNSDSDFPSSLPLSEVTMIFDNCPSQVFAEKQEPILHIDRYDYILYDKHTEWYRDVFIEAIMDDSEMVECVFEDYDINITAESATKTRDYLRTCLMKEIKLQKPTIVLSSLISSICRIKRDSIVRLDKSLLITDLSLDQIVDADIDLSKIREMVELETISIENSPINYVVNCNDNDHVCDEEKNKVVLLINPIVVYLSKEKLVQVDNITTRINTIYLNFNSCELDNMQNKSKITIRIKGIGSLRIDLNSLTESKSKYCNEKYSFVFSGAFLIPTKKKKIKKKRNHSEKYVLNISLHLTIR